MGPGGPLTEGGVRYTIHPVTGHLITTEVQPPAKDVSVSGVHAHKPQREDKLIIKVSCVVVCVSVCLCVSVSVSVALAGIVSVCVCLCGFGWDCKAPLAVLLLMLLFV